MHLLNPHHPPLPLKIRARKSKLQPSQPDSTLHTPCLVVDDIRVVVVVVVIVVNAPNPSLTLKYRTKQSKLQPAWTTPCVVVDEVRMVVVVVAVNAPILPYSLKHKIEGRKLPKPSQPTSTTPFILVLYLGWCCNTSCGCGHGCRQCTSSLLIPQQEKQRKQTTAITTILNYTSTTPYFVVK